MSNYWEDQIANQSEVELLPQEEVKDSEYLSLDLLGLLRIGKLSEEIDIWGNKIGIRTLTVGEELDASLLAKKYAETMDADRAYITALVAATVQYENGVPLIRGMGPNETNTIERRFFYILNNWYWPVVQAVYSNYVSLVQRADSSLTEFKKKS